MMGKGGGALTLEIVRQVIDAADREDAQRGEKCRRRCREMRSAGWVGLTRHPECFAG
jgi:hypothetical protein